jgi:hypothetical protein
VAFIGVIPMAKFSVHTRNRDKLSIGLTGEFVFDQLVAGVLESFEAHDSFSVVLLFSLILIAKSHQLILSNL